MKVVTNDEKRQMKEKSLERNHKRSAISINESEGRLEIQKLSYRT